MIIVGRGDGFDRLAGRLLGQSATPAEIRRKAAQIADFNGIADLRSLQPGQHLRTPPDDHPVSTEVEARFVAEDRRYEQDPSGSRLEKRLSTSRYAGLKEPDLRVAFEDEERGRDAIARAAEGRAKRQESAVVRFREDHGPLRWNGGASPVHAEIRRRAAEHKARRGTREWTAGETLNWKLGRADIFQFKDQWVSGHWSAIEAAAKYFDLPVLLVAGVAYNEVGGDPPIVDDFAYEVRKKLPLKPRNQTSFGDVSIQVRRASQSLDYGGSPDPDQERAIVSSLKDPEISIFVAAKHLADLRDIDYVGRGAADLRDAEIEVIATRFNRGPNLRIDEIKSNLDYGRDITKRKGHILSLGGQGGKP